MGNMARDRRNPPPPLDAARFHDMALGYVARFSTSRAKLVTYLHRKLRERGWEGEEFPDIDDLADRMVEAGYVDDEAYAKAKAGGLLRRGYGARRIGQALHAAGIDEELRQNVAPGEAQRRNAALAMARKRRFGPFGSEPVPSDKREKQIAALLRAGHGFDSARFLVDAANIEAAEQWAVEAEDKD